MHTLIPGHAGREITTFHIHTGYSHHKLQVRIERIGPPFPLRIADDILDELLVCVSDEVVDLCDGYVDGIYSNEFLSPTHQ